MAELPIMIMRMDEREDVQIIQIYLVDAEVLFLCRKRTFEALTFQIDGRNKVLEITSRSDGSRMKFKMIDTEGGHYVIILETQKRKNVLYLEDALRDELGILFLEY